MGGTMVTDGMMSMGPWSLMGWRDHGHWWDDVYGTMVTDGMMSMGPWSLMGWCLWDHGHWWDDVYGTMVTDGMMGPWSLMGWWDHGHWWDDVYHVQLTHYLQDITSHNSSSVTIITHNSGSIQSLNSRNGEDRCVACWGNIGCHSRETATGLWGEGLNYSR